MRFPMHTSRRALGISALVLAAVAGWIGVFTAIAVWDVGRFTSFWAPQRLAAYALFLAAPGLTFFPIGRALGIPLYDVEALVGWSTLAYVMTFVNPGQRPSVGALLVFLISLVIAVATIATLVAYAVGLRLLTHRHHRYDFVRARREGYLFAIFIGGCALLAMLDVFTFVTAGLLGLIIALLEVFLLSRGPGHVPAHDQRSG